MYALPSPSPHRIPMFVRFSGEVIGSTQSTFSKYTWLKVEYACMYLTDANVRHRWSRENASHTR